MQLTVADQLCQVRFLVSERRRWIETLYFDRKIGPDENFPTRYVPIHVCGLEPIFVEQKSTSPNHCRRAISKAADFLSLELARMIEFTLAVKNVALARTALEKDRQCY